MEAIAAEGAIRQLAASPKGSWLAAGEFEKTVSIWDVGRLARVAILDTILDFGGRRLAVSEDGASCFAGAYHRQGIASYSVPEPETRWQRQDLKRVQDMRLSADSTRLYCGFEEGPAHVLDAETGLELERIRGARAVYESRFGRDLLFDTSKPEVHTAAGKSFSLQRESFAILTVDFSPGAVAISESGAVVRFFSLAEGSEIGRYAPQTGSHVLQLAYSESAGAFLGIQWSFAKGGAVALIETSTHGEAHVLGLIGGAKDAVFVDGGAWLVTREGNVFESETGELHKTLAFSASRR